MKSSTPTFIIEKPLVVDDAQHRKLTKAFALATSIYNATLNTAIGQLTHLRQSAEWRATRAMDKGVERNRRFHALSKACGLTQYGLMTVANNHRKASQRGDIGAHEAQEIGKTVWNGLERYLFKQGGRPRFKSRKRGIHSISGTDNHELIFKPEAGTLYWRKEHYRIRFDGSSYEQEALSHRVKYCRVVRRNLNGRVRWYVQLCMEGLPPVRRIYAPKTERVGIDPGPSKVAVYSERAARIFDLAPRVEPDERAIRRLQRQIDRARRQGNPENYNPDGTVKAGPKVWVKSKRQQRLEVRLSEVWRCLAETRKSDHGFLVNLILQLGGTVNIEKNSYRSFQRNFGKSTTKRGAGEFVERLKRGAARANLSVNELNAYELKLSQYDFLTETYTKKPLKERWHKLGNTNTYVQRDMMSAFLACYVTDKKGHDPILLREKWATSEPMLRDGGYVRESDLRNDSADALVSKELTRGALHPTDKKTIVNHW